MPKKETINTECTETPLKSCSLVAKVYYDAN